MQHIRLVFTSGFHPISRLHLGMGAMSYLSSPLWMLSLILSFLSAALSQPASASQRASATGVGHWGAALFAATMALLLLPKLWSYLLLLRDRQRLAECGGAFKVAIGVLLETLVSILVAPIMMAFHSGFVITTLLGRRVQWTAQERDEQGQRFSTALWTHWRQTLAGILAAVATWLLAPEMFFWLIPIFVGLILAIPLSILLSSAVAGRWLATKRLLLIPEETIATKVLQRHRHLLALSPRKELADPRDLFRRVLVDPAFLALHRCMLISTGAMAAIGPKPVLAIQRQLLSGGWRRVSAENRKAVLSDPAALQALHLFAWTSRRGE
jgi:membrane glycosyltransferase